MVFCDWKKDSREDPVVISYIEVQKGKVPTDVLEVDDIPESLPSCSWYLAWIIMFISSLFFSIFFLIYTMMYGRTITMDWFYQALTPTVLGFILGDFLGVIQTSITQTYIFKERLEAPLHYMSTIKWHTLLSLNFANDNDVAHIDSLKNNPEYKPPKHQEQKPAPAFLGVTNLVTDLLCTSLIIILGLIAISSVHERHVIAHTQTSLEKQFINKELMGKIHTKEDFWNWLNDFFVARLYPSSTSMNVLSDSYNFPPAFDSRMTAGGSSFIVQAPCLVRISKNRVWWNVYQNRELTIGGEKYCMGVTKQLADDTNRHMIRHSWLHRGMIGTGLEITVYMPYADIVTKLFCTFEMQLGGGLKPYYKMESIALLSGEIRNSLFFTFFILLAGLLLLVSYYAITFFYPNAKLHNSPNLIYLSLLIVLLSLLDASLLLFNALEWDKNVEELILNYQLATFKSIQIAVQGSGAFVHLVFLVTTFKLLLFLRQMLSTDLFLDKFWTFIQISLIPILSVCLLFFPIYMGFNIFFYYNFSREICGTRDVPNCRIFITAAMAHCTRLNHLYVLNQFLPIFLAIFYFVFCIFGFVVAAAMLDSYPKAKYWKEHKANRLPVEVLLLRFVPGEEVDRKRKRRRAKSTRKT